VRKLDSHLKQWVAEGLISSDQAGAILARHPVKSRNGWPIAYAIIGAVLCISGVSLLIASNWQQIPPLVKLLGLLILLAASTIVGTEAQRRGAGRGVWECGFLGAAIFPLLGLSLISQIFHLSGTMSGLAGAWLLAITPLMLLSRSGAAFVVWIVAGYWWLGARLAETAEDFHMWQYFGVFAAVGAVIAAGSQAWLAVGRRELRGIGEFFGVATVALSLWLVGFDCKGWFLLWTALFVAGLGWIWFSMIRERVHQVNLGFVVVGLVILSVFVRLVGTMAHTGFLFINGGVALLVISWALAKARARLLEKMS